MFYSIVTMPSASDVLSSTTAYSGTLFTDFLPVIWLAVGVLVAVMAVKFVARYILKGSGNLFGKGKWVDTIGAYGGDKGVGGWHPGAKFFVIKTYKKRGQYYYK